MLRQHKPKSRSLNACVITPVYGGDGLLGSSRKSEHDPGEYVSVGKKGMINKAIL
jgi:hypothetical protein